MESDNFMLECKYKTGNSLFSVPFSSPAHLAGSERVYISTLGHATCQNRSRSGKTTINTCPEGGLKEYSVHGKEQVEYLNNKAFGELFLKRGH